MTRYSKIILTLLATTLCTATLWAQSNGCNSSYSRFGLGTLNDQNSGFNRSMSGVGIGMRTGSRINNANPAAYSGIDSLSFIFDVGMNMSTGTLRTSNAHLNVRNASLDYVHAGLRLTRGLGMAFGFTPYSTIGYKFGTESKVGNDFTTGQPILSKSTYAGDGGIHRMYLGLGWRPFANLSIGANINFLWGDYNHQLAQSFSVGGESDGGYSSLYSTHEASVRTYRVDLGIQYPIRLTSQDWLTLGAIAELGHNTHDTSTLTRYTSSSSGADSTVIQAHDAFSLPYVYGGGISWQHGGRILVAADYRYEHWADCLSPMTGTAADGSLTYSGKQGAYLDRSRFAVGAEWIPAPTSRKYKHRIQYKAGFSYSTPQLRVNGQDGPREYGVTAGVGIPISNNINNRSVVNFGLQWMHRKPSSTNMITENYLMMNVGMTFNERWFMKFKIQ